MKPHLETAHRYWKEILKPADTVIDATCGNGKDTQVLAGLVPEGHVFSLDIQEIALQKAKRLTGMSNVTLMLRSHERLPLIEGVKLVVYNLGYLPGGDKGLTTQTQTTLKSLEHALEISPAVSVTCYPGHPEGALEEVAIEAFSKSLDPKVWSVRWFRWRIGSPSLLIVIKIFNLHSS